MDKILKLLKNLHQKTALADGFIKKAFITEGSLVGSLIHPRLIHDKLILTQKYLNVKLSMAESGGNDPHSAEPNDSCIRRSPDLRDSLSSHGMIIPWKDTITRLNQKGVIPPIAIVVVLLAGLATGLLLVRQTQIFKPKATTIPIAVCQAGCNASSYTPCANECNNEAPENFQSCLDSCTTQYNQCVTDCQSGGGGQCPANATACWEGAGCPAPGTSQQDAADQACAVNHTGSTACDPDDPGPFGDGCTGPGGGGGTSGSTCTVTANPSTAAAGSPVSFSATGPSGYNVCTTPSSPFTVTGPGIQTSGTCLGSGNSWNCTARGSGQSTFTARMAPGGDCTSNTPTSCSTTFTVSGTTGGNLTVSCSATPTAPTVGQAVTWLATVGGGSGTYTYTWSGGPNTADSLSSNTNTATKVYTTSGNKTAAVTVTSGTQQVGNCSVFVSGGGGVPTINPSLCVTQGGQCSSDPSICATNPNCGGGSGTTPVNCTITPQLGTCTPAGGATCGTVQGTQTVTMTGGSPGCTPVTTTQSCTAILPACGSGSTTPVNCTTTPVDVTACSPTGGGATCGTVNGTKTVRLTGGSTGCTPVDTTQTCTATLAACTGVATPTPSPTTGPQQTPTNTPPPTQPPSNTTTYGYKVSENSANLADDTNFLPYNNLLGEDFPNNFTFADPSPGVKTVFVRFFGRDSTGNKVQSIIHPAPITVLKPPKIAGCNVTTVGNNTQLEILGTNFGTASGATTSGTTGTGQTIPVVSWADDKVVMNYPNAPIGQSFTIGLTTADRLTALGACSSISPLALQANLFCPQVKDVTFPNTEVTIVEGRAGGQVINDRATLKVLKGSGIGVLENLDVKLEAGKGYKLAIKVPKGIRRVLKNPLGGFIAVPGTTNVDFTVTGGGAKLPLGDIFPSGSGDGSINSADFVQLKNDIAAAKTASNIYSDLNQDSVVNSFEWACMRPDLGSSDDPIPTAGPLTGLRTPTPTASPSATPRPTPTP